MSHALRASRWYPQRVYHPSKEPKRPFQGREEWTYVLKLLEGGAQEVKVITLDIPPGAEGWVMKVYTKHDPRHIYIKLQLDEDGFVIGRSFHYSDRR